MIKNSAKLTPSWLVIVLGDANQSNGRRSVPAILCSFYKHYFRPEKGSDDHHTEQEMWRASSPEREWACVVDFHMLIIDSFKPRYSSVIVNDSGENDDSLDKRVKEWMQMLWSNVYVLYAMFERNFDSQRMRGSPYSHCYPLVNLLKSWAS